MKQLSLTEQERIQPIDLKGELERRFLWYAVSTIASRALPDVRDGLKPVHRRILYAMYRMRLLPDAKYRKSAAVVGDVLGKYHPHGDQAAYDTLVRLAQEFSLRYPLISGHGNFGSIDGDSAAAMRYTEAKLTPIAVELLSEIDRETVEFSPNYDSTTTEPRFLPARLPNLLINGSTGIAVGMATSIPPHNLSEVTDACIAMIDDRGLSVAKVMKFIKAPDFPTGAVIQASKKELQDIYETGKGTIKVRSEYKMETGVKNKKQIVFTSLPYMVNKSKLIEKIANVIISKKVPVLYDIRDESAEDIRVVVELKGEFDEAKVLAYLYRHTDLEYTVPMNLTALDSNSTPRRMSLIEILNSFLIFRIDTVKRRMEYDLKKILERLHILTALARVLKDIDAAIAIIRKSKSRDEAKEGLKKKFKLDEVQAVAVLDLRLSALVRMEVFKIEEEEKKLDEQRREIEAVLKSEKKIEKLVKDELREIKEKYGDKRRTKVATAALVAEDELAISDADFITHEATFAIISKNGWIRRMKKEPNLEQIRFKDGDSLLSVIPCDTSEFVTFFSSAGKFYTTSVYDIPQTTGFGSPIQSRFKFGDGERVVAVEHITGIGTDKVVAGEYLVVTENGNGFRFAKSAVTETTRAGKKYASLKGDNQVSDVLISEKPFVYVAGSGGKALLFPVKEIPILSGVGAGVRMIKLGDGHRVVSVKPVEKKGKLRLTFDSGRDAIVDIKELEVGKRASTGRSYGNVKKKLLAVTYE